MRIIQNTQFNSAVLVNWMKEQSSVNLLLRRVMRKLAVHGSAAKRDKVYSFVYLWKIQDILTKCQQLIDNEGEKYKVLLKDKSPSLLTRTKPDSPIIIEHKIGNQIFYQLIFTLEKLDAAFYLIDLCKLTGVFRLREVYHEEVMQMKNLFFKALTDIMQYIPLIPPTVSFDDYLEETNSYKNAKEKYGYVSPEILFNILQSSLVPALPHLQVEKIINLLNQKKRLPRKAILAGNTPYPYLKPEETRSKSVPVTEADVVQAIAENAASSVVITSEQGVSLPEKEKTKKKRDVTKDESLSHEVVPEQQTPLAEEQKKISTPALTISAA